jgi:hypothetical protein
MNGLAHAVACVGQISCLGRSAKGRPMELDRASDRLRPEGNGSRRKLDFCAVGDEAMFFDQV